MAPKNHNALITNELEKLATAYKNTNDTWRAFGYEKAIAAIKKHPEPITSGQDVAGIRGVGAKMADKIQVLCAEFLLRAR